MHLIEIAFWLCAATLVYTYVGYGLILWIFSKLKDQFRPVKTPANKPYTPPVTLVIPAFNEEEVIEDKIRNSQSLIYPAEKLQIFVVTDGSSDATPAKACRFPGITVLHEAERAGEGFGHE